MSKTKILALSAILAMLLACGSQDGSPPELKNKDMLRVISPFDTLVAEFDSEIVNKLDELTKENIIAETYVNWKPIDRPLDKENKESLCYSKKTLCFIGNNEALGGAHYFDLDVREDSIVFLGLKNSDGTRKRTVLRFSTYDVFDMESNGNELNAYDIDSKALAGATFAGVLRKNIGDDGKGNVSYNVNDFYKLYLAARNKISITASNQGRPFSVIFYGPCHGQSSDCNYDSIYVNKKIDSLQTTIKYGHLLPTDITGTPANFYIKISDENNLNKPTPYLLTVKTVKVTE